jgi:esterase/lipase
MVQFQQLKMKNTIIPITLLFLLSCSGKKNNTTELYLAGFKIIQSKDTTRIYKPNTNTTDNLHYRPLDIDIWYPASASTKDTTHLYKYIFGLYETRANYYTASTIGNGISTQIAHFFCDRLGCSDSLRVLNFRTRSFKDATAINHKFPLVIYLCAFNGMSYENFPLFEELSQNGFVVVCISSNGRFPGDMTTKKEDMLEQVNDAIASIKELKQSTNIDFDNVGIVGYSWGGLSGAVLASKIANVKCLISFDGSEFHHYGKAKDENTDFDRLRYSEDFKKMRISLPYLRLESSVSDDDTEEEYDSVYNFSEKLSSNIEIFKIDSTRHEDFGCLPYIVRQTGNCKGNQPYTTISKLAVSFLSEHLRNEKQFSKVVEQEMNKTMRRK